MSNIALTVDSINSLSPLEIVTNEAVKSRFIQIYDTLWGAGTGEPAYERESFHFNNILREDERLQKATNFSIFTCFIDLAVSGLSVEKTTKAQGYLQGRNVKVGKDSSGKDIYEGHLKFTVSGYGELVMRERAGQIRYADNPVLVYEEDDFSYGDVNGQKVVNYMCHLPHKSNHIVACFLRITRADGSVDYSVMLEEDWIRLQSYSAKQNRKWDNTTRTYVESANDLYTSRNGGIDTGFLTAKLIKHAFKTYPKVRMGKGTELESQVEDTTQKDIDDFYGIESAPNELPSVTVMPQSFSEPQDISTGVKIETIPEKEEDNDDAF